MVMKTSHEIPGQTCPICVCPLDDVLYSGPFGEEPAKPHSGDITICVSCSGLLQFDKEMKLKIVSDEEAAKFAKNVRNNIVSAQLEARKNMDRKTIN